MHYWHGDMKPTNFYSQTMAPFDSSCRTINVEYNMLDPLLKASGYPDGDENDKDTGFSPFPGNINQLLFMAKPYAETLERTKGIMPEFVNPKYKDKAKTVFKKPTRLECMMQVRTLRRVAIYQ